jgi:hypothetical protein
VGWRSGQAGPLTGIYVKPVLLEEARLEPGGPRGWGICRWGGPWGQAGPLTGIYVKPALWEEAGLEPGGPRAGGGVGGPVRCVPGLVAVVERPQRRSYLGRRAGRRARRRSRGRARRRRAMSGWRKPPLRARTAR